MNDSGKLSRTAFGGGSCQSPGSRIDCSFDWPRVEARDVGVDRVLGYNLEKSQYLGMLVRALSDMGGTFVSVHSPFGGTSKSEDLGGSEVKDVSDQILD